MLDQLVVLAERSLVKEAVDTLARRQLALGVLRIDALLSAAGQSLLAELVEPGNERLWTCGRAAGQRTRTSVRRSSGPQRTDDVPA